MSKLVIVPKEVEEFKPQSGWHLVKPVIDGAVVDQTVCQASSFSQSSGGGVSAEGQAKLILKNFQSPGDVVIMAFALKSLHETYPGRFLTDVRTTCPAIFEGNPYITPLHESDVDMVIDMTYDTIHQSNQKPYHYLNGMMIDLQTKLRLPIVPTFFQSFIYIREQEHFWYSAVFEKVKRNVPYWIIDAGYKTDYTAKQWAFDRYQKIIDRFPELTFVQIGLDHPNHVHPELKGENLINMVGQTDLRQLIRLVYNSWGVITPVSLPMMLAYAVPPHPRFQRHSRACIVIAGGREPNHWQQGPNQQFIHTCGLLPCCDLGGCWKSRVMSLGDGDHKDEELCLCPVKLSTGQTIAKCMDMITADDVCRLVKFYMDNLNYEISPVSNVEIAKRPKVVVQRKTVQSASGIKEKNQSRGRKKKPRRRRKKNKGRRTKSR